MGNRPHGLGRPRPDSAAPGVFGRGPSDPTAPHYDGAALNGWRRIGRGPARPTCQGLGGPALSRPGSGTLRPAPTTSSEVLGQKSLRGTPGVPAPLKLRAGPRRPAPLG